MTGRAPWILVLAAVLFALFVVYGSLVPLHYTPRPLGEAWSLFLHAEGVRAGIASRTDTAANVILLAPLPFLWLSIGNPRRVSRAAAASVLVWILCLLFSIGVELAQVYFPPRVPAHRDVIAQAVGTAIGIGLWWIWGVRFRSAVDRWRTAYGPARVAQAILWPYLVVLLLYNLMPLDLTVSPAAIFHKWKEGNIVLLPFGGHVDDPAERAFGTVLDVLLWVPVAALLVLGGRMSASRAWLLTAAASACVEGVQILVASRVADVTDVLAGTAGGGVGAWAGARLRRQVGVAPRLAPSRARSRRLRLGAALAGLWMVVLAVLFWYPFDFRIEGVFARERLPMLRSIPFGAYWSGSELRALSGVFQKTLAFAPLGAALALACESMRRARARAAARIGAVLLVGATAFGIELGQVLLPAKVPDSTDVLLGLAGGLFGYLLFTLVERRLGMPERRGPA